MSEIKRNSYFEEIDSINLKKYVISFPDVLQNIIRECFTICLLCNKNYNNKCDIYGCHVEENNICCECFNIKNYSKYLCVRSRIFSDNYVKIQILCDDDHEKREEYEECKLCSLNLQKNKYGVQYYLKNGRSYYYSYIVKYS